MEASIMQKSSIISDLKHELNETRKRLNQLEDERKIYENESLSLNDRNTNLIKSLEKQIEQLSNQKVSLNKDFSLKINQLEETSKKELDKLRTDYQIEKQTLVDNYETKLNMEMVQYQEKILTLERVILALKFK